MAQSMKAKFPQLTDEALNKERAKSLRSPVLIAVGVDKPTDPKFLRSKISARPLRLVKIFYWPRMFRVSRLSGGLERPHVIRWSKSFWALLKISILFHFFISDIPM